MPEFKHKLLTKGEYREMVAQRMRDPKTTTKQFLELSELYNLVSNKRTKMAGPNPTKDDLDDLVLKLEEKKHG